MSLPRPQLPTVWVAVVGGLLLAASLPPMGFWPLAVVGLALVDASIDGAGRRARFARGFAAGLALLAPTTWWMHDMTLPGWVIASLVLSAMLGGALAAVPPAAPARWLALPGAWLLFEAVRGRWPFGGVPLSNLAVGQVGGPLAGVARVGNSLLLGAVTVAAALAVAAAARRRWRPAAAAAGAVAVALVLAGVAPTGTGTGRTIEVAVVQGGGPQGTRAIDTDERRVTERHLEASEDVEANRFDLVLWPEDVVDIDGDLADAPEGEELADLSRRVGGTLVVGVIEQFGDIFTNEAKAFVDGEVVDTVGKERRVPFGEYVPFRSLIEPVAPDALTSRDAVVATGPAVLETPAGRLGVAISWEIFFPDRARDAIGNGGQVLLNPTNGSSFSGTQVQTQQIASSRLRAIETGRWVVQAAPTGFSALITPGGRVLGRTDVSERAIVEGTVELRDGRTWAVRFGDWLPLAVGVLSLAGGWALALRRDRRARLDGGDGGGGEGRRPAPGPDEQVAPVAAG